MKMTEKETSSYLKELDSYFRIHGWCTQMDDKISSFLGRLNRSDREHVRKWAYAALEKKNSKSASHIMAIILLKLLDASDKELVSLLYTVLSGRLTFEDFNSLNTYVFKGKPPLSRDLFYNITERVFIDKQSALKKALSISSIISEADPELTIFYMTMLLCRVDLNNENRAMLNLLLYCIDADIPDEVSHGVREYLLSIKDVLEEILSSEENTEIRTALETVYIHMDRERENPGIITIEKKEERRAAVKEADRKEDKDLFPRSGTEQKQPAAVQHTVLPRKRKENDDRKKQMEPFPEKDAQKRGKKPLRKNVSEGKSHETFSVPSAEDAPLSVSGENGQGPSEIQRSMVREEEPRGPFEKETEEEAVIKKNVEKSTLQKKRTPLQTVKSSGSGEVSVLEQPEEEKDVSEREHTAQKEQYELKLRKFRLSDLFSGKTSAGAVSSEERKSRKKRSGKSMESPGGESSFLPRKHRLFLWGFAVIIVFAVSGWLLLKPGISRVPASSHNAVSAAPVLPQAAVSSPGGKPLTVASPSAASDNTAIPPVPGKHWKLKETDKGLEWTVQKGESVWKLYMYLSSHVSKLSGPLRVMGEMDWLPFIHRVIALNPQKSFAEPIEPGEVFLLSRQR